MEHCRGFQEEVDKINIHNASLLAMEKAVESLVCHCEEARALAGRRSNLHNGRKDCFGRTRNDNVFLFVDGKFRVPNLNNIEQEAIIGGDNKVLSIAAASIIAKVYRDKLMQKLHCSIQFIISHSIRVMPPYTTAK